MKRLRLPLAFVLIASIFLMILAVVFSLQFVTTSIAQNALISQQKQIYKNETLTLSGQLIDTIDSIMKQTEILSQMELTKRLGEDKTLEEEMKSIFRSIKNSFGDNINFIYFGYAKDGKLLIYPNASLSSDYDARKRPWYQEAIKYQGKVILSPIFTNAVTKKLSTTAAKAIVKDGKVTGVMGIDIDLDKFSKMVSQKKIGKSGYIVVMNEDGTILMHPDKSRINTPSVLKSYVPIMKSKKQGEIDYTYQNKRKSAFYSYDKITKLIFFSAIEKGEIQQVINDIKSKIIKVSIIIFVIIMLIVLIFVQFAIKTFKKVKNASERLKDGDLSSLIDGSSFVLELSQMIDAYNKAISTLKNSVKVIMDQAGRVNSNAMNLSAISEQITSSSQEVSSSTNQLAEAMNELAESMTNIMRSQEEYMKNLDEIENVFVRIQGLTHDVSELSKDGNEKISEIVLGINQLKTRLSNMFDSINSFVSKTTNIESIIQTIKSISDQTNLLSLNASIEAAKAGESGKGFSIVAYEIRKLSEQTKDSVSNISKMISDIKLGIQSVLQTAGNLMEESDAQVSKINTSTENLKKVIESASIIEPEVRSAMQILAVNKKMNEEIVKNIERITSVSEQTAASGQEIAAASTEMSRGSEEVAESAQQLAQISSSVVESVKMFKV